MTRPQFTVCDECGLPIEITDGANVIWHPPPVAHLVLAAVCESCVRDGLI